MFSHAQLSLHLTAAAPIIVECGLVPEHLAREAAVLLSEPTLMMSDERAAEIIRQALTPEQISAELNRISDVAKNRETFGDYGSFLFHHNRTGYPCIDHATTAMNWMYAHESKRVHQLKLALPSQGECVAAARERIQARIAARKNRRATTACSAG
ncbi:TPA: hypothetical protein L4F62_006464 [Pseudomonas aeruginosa]|uniref:hypothetical protein n=1 Tax=Pseudomonas aeruginosa TaxID=287 RepID=UPI0025574A04|nr:hypothetical protein [Pseudomonas aeruginosa]HBO1619903.1 hypothetical protein [Pseudomonas aeruginosa]HBO9386133.1 hypothetical protein [Pseudomonas aeruginosa]HCF2940947.1 hypothetical protein [Pseudomonas aeruginosa]